MINEIKEALEKATPGPWAAESNKIMQDKYDRDDYRVLLCNVYRGPRWEADSKLIANSPTYIRYLLDELEKAQKENEALRHRDKIVSLTNETLGRYVREGKEEISRLKAVANEASK